MSRDKKWQWQKYMRPPTIWHDDWNEIKVGLPYDFDKAPRRGSIAVIVFKASVMGLDTRTEKDRFKFNCLIVGFLPLAYAKRIKGTEKAVDVWDIVGVIPSDNMQKDLEILKSEYGLFRYHLPNCYYFGVNHFMDLMKTMTSVYLNTWAEIQPINYDTESQLETAKIELKVYAAREKSLQAQIEKHSQNNITLQLENDELRKEIHRLMRDQDPDKHKGYVYLLKVENEENVFKIGRAKNPKNRLRTFNVKLPFPVSFEHVIQTDDMYSLEHQLHVRYALKRQEGSEFFLLEDDDVQYIKMLGQYVSIDRVTIEVDNGFKMKVRNKPNRVKILNPEDVFNLDTGKKKRGRR